MKRNAFGKGDLKCCVCGIYLVCIGYLMELCVASFESTEEPRVKQIAKLTLCSFVFFFKFFKNFVTNFIVS